MCLNVLWNVTSALCDSSFPSPLWPLPLRMRWTALQFPLSWAELMNRPAAASHIQPLMRGKAVSLTVHECVCVCVRMARIPTVYISECVLWVVSSIKTWYSNTCWVCLPRNALLFLGVMKWQQFAVSLFTLFTVNHSHKEKTWTHCVRIINTVRLLSCAHSELCDTSKNFPVKDHVYVCRQALHACVSCVLYMYQYLRAICRAEQSASSLLSVILICSDSPFLRSRAAVSLSFLAFSLSMHLRSWGRGWRGFGAKTVENTLDSLLQLQKEFNLMGCFNLKPYNH